MNGDTSGQFGPKYEERLKAIALTEKRWPLVFPHRTIRGKHKHGGRGGVCMSEHIPLTELASVNIDAVNKDDLVDVSGFTFDNSIPQEQRAARILKMVKNPYCFRVGDMGVKLEFSEDAPALQDVFTDFLIRKKSGL
jgi:hypothetical protein